MTKQMIGRRLEVQCAWCRTIQLIPEEWGGDVIECMGCGKEGRAYGYLSEPEPMPTVTRRRREEPDCDGGLIRALMVVVGLWMLIATAVYAILLW